MVRAAMRAGAGETLREELKVSRPGLLEFLGPAAGRMFDKLYRFGGEMDEIAEFLADEPGGPEVFAAFRAVFAELAADRAGSGREIGLLCQFYEDRAAGPAVPAGPRGPLPKERCMKIINSQIHIWRADTPEYPWVRAAPRRTVPRTP